MPRARFRRLHVCVKNVASSCGRRLRSRFREFFDERRIEVRDLPPAPETTRLALSAAASASGLLTLNYRASRRDGLWRRRGSRPSGCPTRPRSAAREYCRPRRYGPGTARLWATPAVRDDRRRPVAPSRYRRKSRNLAWGRSRHGPPSGRAWWIARWRQATARAGGWGRLGALPMMVGSMQHHAASATCVAPGWRSCR